MIDRDKIKELVKASLPQDQIGVVERIVDNIIRDVEAVIHSMVRQEIEREREKRISSKKSRGIKFD